ncbi:MAG: PSD1 and planctomycete cytochrome C domain-containing protein [Bythopirellula sp.]
MRSTTRIVATLTLGWLAAHGTTASAQQQISPADADFFESKIRPVLVQQCYGCHSTESGKTRGGLLLDSRAATLQGGESGPAIAPGNLAESLLWSAINYDSFEMPPRGQLPADVIADFQRWIKMGAPDPRVRQAVVVESEIDIEAGRQHWAFQKPTQPVLPSVSNESWPKAVIDFHILATLDQQNLKPVEDADAATLLRRLHFDLTGLPPTPLDVHEFWNAVEEDREAAIAAKVDELLASPQFGERWGRHWLDVARYAESSGKSVNVTFPHAWRYRDYVIDSFNEDKPYDRFIKEQIAGDLLPIRSDEDWQENLIATGFLAVGTKSLIERNPRQFRADLIDEQIDTMSKAFLGVTVACARCHDHKFDPIPTTDYYALAGIFLNTDTCYGTASGIQNRQATELLLLPIEDETPAGRIYSEQEVAGMNEALRNLRSRMFEVRRNRENVSQQLFIRTRAQMSRIQGTLAELKENGQPQTFAMGVQPTDVFHDAPVLVRGDVEQPAQTVPRGFLQVLHHAETPEIAPDSSGRRELADWLSSPENPLTARVMVNRIWLHLFGEGIVATPNNWGFHGQPPTHPALLDHLAVRFMKNQWSLKSMIREIVLSRTYQLSSAFDQENYQTDPENRYLWRVNQRQLDAEALRDAILAMGGSLNLQRPLGSPMAQLGNNRVGRTLDPSFFNGLNDRRSVYLPVVREALPNSLALFDFADPSLSNAKRDMTNVPTQALYLLNNEFVLQQAERLGQYLLENFENSREQIDWAFLIVYGRLATDDEIRSSQKFLDDFTSKADRSTDSRANTTQLAMTTFCQALIASAEFRFLN